MKKLLFILLLAGNILVICQPTLAQQQQDNNRWQFVGRGSNGSFSFLDKSAQKQTGDVRRTWSKEVFSDGSYKIGLVDWQCSARKFRILEGATFKPSGEYIYREDKPSSWISVFPDSVSENYYKVVCASAGQQTLSPQSKSAESKTTAEVIVANARVRTSPTADSNIVRRVEKGARLFLADTEPTNGWYRVFISGTNETGWIYGSTVKLSAPAQRKTDKIEQKKPKTLYERGKRSN